MAVARLHVVPTMDVQGADGLARRVQPMIPRAAIVTASVSPPDGRHIDPKCTSGVVRCGRMATAHPRIQVTVDDELEQALTRVDPAPASKSRLVRDLALRGAQAIEQERASASDALTVLLEIADGTRDYDLAASGELSASRGDRLP